MEGPSLVILKEEMQPFKGKKIIEVTGNSSLDLKVMENEKLIDIKSWGKHSILVFKNFAIRIHFLMFGSYRINEGKEGKTPRMSWLFKEGVVNFYTCSIKFIELDLDSIYDWSIDTMSDQWDEKKAVRNVSKQQNRAVCDVILDQDIFAGVGNIIKNEVLFNLQMHPEIKVEALSPKQIKQLVKETREYCFSFYKWKKVFELRKHWNIYKRRKCTVCSTPATIGKTGKGQRLSYYCPICQPLLVS